MDSFKIGVLRETKTPPDRRVALPPNQIVKLQKSFPEISIVVQPSTLRCFADEEYLHLGIPLQEDLSDCDLLVGVKEVKINTLIPEKTYVFFAHVAKEQPYNVGLLQAILKKRIRLLDYEYFTHTDGARLIAFGRWAGIVGAYNALRGYGMQSGDYKLTPAHECHDLAEMYKELGKVVLNDVRILVSGGGRVASGAMETLEKLNIPVLSPPDFLKLKENVSAICRIDPEHYAARKDGAEFKLQHFFDHPSEYISTALPYFRKANIYIAAHYWDPESPRIFELEDLAGRETMPRVHVSPPFPKVIADISCDINGSVPTTTHATTIAEPYYYYGDKKDLLMMTVDNLPGELPRDASNEFSEILVKEILPRIVKGDPDGVIERATITDKGKLTSLFDYLEDYSKGL